MPGQMQAALKIAMKYGPKIGAAIAVLSTFLNENPGISTWSRKRIQEINKRIEALSNRGDAARIREMLDIVRDVAQDSDVRDGGWSEAHAEQWKNHADNIGHRVRLAEALPKPDRKRALAELLTETETLLADAINALARVSSGESVEPPVGDSQLR